MLVTITKVEKIQGLLHITETMNILIFIDKNIFHKRTKANIYAGGPCQTPLEHGLDPRFVTIRGVFSRLSI